MKNHVCIAIGINQYQYLQPLSYAQNDAEELHRFLVSESGFSPDQSLLMSDSSPEMWGIPTYPNRQNILDWIEAACKEQLQAGDFLCCFFSGYGFTHNGQDYLLPIDGNPNQLEATGIPIKVLLESLKDAPTENLLVLLDINRSQGARAGDAVGAATMELANQLAIPTVLSCRPDQMSRETSALRQGFFTAAILEGLKSRKYNTIQSLCHFLSDRLPRLSDQHLRPPQDPVFVLNPAGNIDQLILPKQLPTKATVGSQNGNGFNHSTPEPRENGSGIPPRLGGERLPLSSGNGNTTFNSSSAQLNQTPEPSDGSREQASPQTNSATSQKSPEETMSDKSFLQQLILWSGATALLLLLGVFYKNHSIFVGQQQPAEISPTPATELVETSSETETTSEEPSASDATPPASTSTEPESTTIPPQSSANLALLDRSKVQLQASSASGFSQAIALANQIPENDPLYPTAQENIERWSQTILDIAQGRAQTNNFSNAIAAANLVPQSNRQVYQQSQLEIQKWQQKQQQLEANRTQLKIARARIKQGQASSYSNAIDEARKVKADQPGYGEAQTVISQWSAEILKIAESRATKRQYNDAIKAAQLVPADTSSSETAQKAIAKWQTQLKTQKKK